VLGDECDDAEPAAVAGICIGNPTNTMSFTLISNLRRQRFARMHSNVARTTSGYLKNTCSAIHFHFTSTVVVVVVVVVVILVVVVVVVVVVMRVSCSTLWTDCN